MKTSLEPTVLVLDERVSVLPRQLFAVWAVMPVCFTPILVDDFFSFSTSDQLWTLLGNYIPFLGIPAVFQVLYDCWLGSVVRRLRGLVRVAGFHFAVTTVVGLLMGEITRYVHFWVIGHLVDRIDWNVPCLVFSWLFIGVGLFVGHLDRKARLQEHMAEYQRRSALEAQLSALQSRTNPHFFFNSINTVASLIPEDPDLAERTLERLGELMRYALDGSKVKFVSLERELAIIEDYLEIQSARFGDRFTWHLDLDPVVRSVPIPPLTLQPIVENAVLHGIAPQSGGGKVWVSARLVDGRVEVRVADNGPGPGASEKKGTGTAIADLSERLRLLYGRAGGLEIGPRPQGGFQAVITLPAEGVP
ncbi:MAG: histidine kinase [Myxococcales bacterium]|nr:histidine kinase [Myxococcales bacterium]